MEKRKIELLALVLPIFLLFFVQGVFSLQEVAGPLVIQTPIGGTNSTQWGLLNDGSQPITVNLSATGNAAQYLSYPATVDLSPGIIVYTTITANIPTTSSGGNITGNLYALQQGNSGQVQINVQMIKSVTIMVTGSGSSTSSTTSTTTTTTTQTTSTTSTTTFSAVTATATITSTSTTTTINAPSAVSFVNLVNGNVGGGYDPDPCQTSGRICTASSLCCAGLTCQNGICVNISANSSTTTTVPTATTTTTAPTSTTATTSPSIFTGFATLLAYQPLYLIIIFVFSAIILVFAVYKMRNKKKKPETDSNANENL